ncbi:hypothetical protein DPMN_118529 [Dreissena polymorpha]|uniref:Uncharacterized protein n=1 Tax=Dreissena polymorpha TaxID=45954 RepID=A0A9D4GKC5_DREPO|nr:hypothetical protein DPMN_118529 [Dreissena polymorpha]
MDAAMEQQTYWTAKQNLALSMVKAGHNVYIRRSGWVRQVYARNPYNAMGGE